MLVKNWMSKAVITVDVDDSLDKAANLLKQHGIRGLPVLKKGRLVGVVTDRDLKRASASDAKGLEMHELLHLIAKIKVKEVMTKDPVTLPFDYTMEEAAEILLKRKISMAPVVDHEGNLLGVVTRSDIFRVLLSLTGIPNRGIQFGFKVRNRPGSVKEVTDILRNYGCRLVSLLSTFEEDPAGYRHLYIRAFNCDREKVGKMKEELQSKTKLLYMVDHREREKQFYEDYEAPSPGFWEEWSRTVGGKSPKTREAD